MPQFEDEFALILKSTVKIGRRTTTYKTAMGDLRPTGESIIYTGLSVYMDYNPGKYAMEPSGNFVRTDYTMMARYNADIQPGDRIYPVTLVTGLTLGKIETITPIFDFDGNTHHIEASISRIG